MLATCIKDLSAELGLDAPLPEVSPGSYALTIDDDIVIQINKAGEGVSFSCSVAPCPKMRKGDFLSEMMLANLFGQGTFRAVLGLNESSDAIVLTRTLEHIIDYKAFSDALEDFMAAVDFWREQALSKK